MSGKNDAAMTAKIHVWWDMKDCPVPEGIDALRVRPSIEGGFKEQGYSGPVSIAAYGDHKQTPEHLLRALSSTGVAVVHIRSESTCAVMYLDMVKWREDNPPPATMMIITNQMLDVFQWDLARLQQRTSYDIFLAYSIKPVAELFVETRKEWLWEKLLHGTTSTSVDTAGELSTVFHCESCSLDCQSVKSFKKHLSTKKHAIEEVLNPQPTQLISVTKRWGKNYAATPEYATAKIHEVLNPQPTQLISVTKRWGKNYAATPEYATAKIHVCWDMSECPIPDGYDARRVRPSLEGAFKELGYSGPVSITAFGDHKQTPERHLHALSSTGIDVAHAIPEFIYDRMYDDLKRWRDNNPTPTTMMIISDGAEYAFGDSLARLKQLKKYNLFWVYSFRPWKMSVMLTSAEWLWDSLLAGVLFYYHSSIHFHIYNHQTNLLKLLVSETKRHVLRKCSGSSERVVESTGMFYCKMCFSKRKRLDKFMKHLSSKKHISLVSILSLSF
ncbi:hypothetical protein F2Q69_00025324, partial [Brassica cretica]